MSAVYRRELRAYFTGMTAYVFIAFLLLFAGIYTMAYNLTGAYPNFEYVLQSMSIIFLIAIPILTMRVIAEERRQKTDQLLYALPIGMTRVVLGKYLAMITVVAIPCVIMGFYPLILRSFGNVPLGTAYGTLLAFFLLSCTLGAVGMLISSLTDNQAVAAGLCFVVMLLLYFMNSLAGFLSDSDGLLSTVMDSLSVFERFYTFVNGVFDLTAVLYFLSIIGVCLFVTVQMMEKRRCKRNPASKKKRFSLKAWLKSRSFRAGGYSTAAIVIVIAIAVAVNLFAGALPSAYTHLDTTASGLFTLSAQTQQLVGALDADVTIYWMAQSGSEDDTLKELLDRYTGLSEHLTVEKKDPVVYPNFASQYTSSALYNNSLIVVSGDRSQYISYTDIYVTDYMSYYTTGSASTEFAGESALTSAIDYVTSDNLP